MEDIRGAIDEGRYSKFKEERLDMLRHMITKNLYKSWTLSEI